MYDALIANTLGGAVSRRPDEGIVIGGIFNPMTQLWSLEFDNVGPSSYLWGTQIISLLTTCGLGTLAHLLRCSSDEFIIMIQID